MNSILKFGFYNAASGLLVGTLAWLGAVGDGYFIFPIVGTLAAFLTGVSTWSALCNSTHRVSKAKAVTAGLITGTISHYVSWVLLSVWMNICHAVTGGCTDSLGAPPAPITSMLTGGLYFSFFSLIFFGWITVPASVIIGIMVNKQASASVSPENL